MILRLIFAIGICLASTHSYGTASREKSPNFLVIFVDDLNTYLGCMGNPNAITPHIDRLSKDGVLFKNAHCQAPLCGPSRASIMSGLRPSTTGIYGQMEDEKLRDASEVMRYVKFLPEYFREHGYTTIGIGKLFHEHAPKGMLDISGGRAKGFGPKPEDGKHFKWDKKGTSTDWGAFPESNSEMPDFVSAEWVTHQLSREHEKPFFMAVGFLRPHVPWYVPQEWFDLYEPASLSLPEYLKNDFEDIPLIAQKIDELPMMPTTSWAIKNGEWRNILRAYLASVSFVDAQVGKILSALERSKYSKNTVVVLLSDQGYRIGEKGKFAKHCLWREVTRVPLIIRGPGIKQNHRVGTSVELLDLYPTLVELAGLPENPMNEGESLTQFLRGKEKVLGDDVAITTYGRNNHSIATKGYHYIRYSDGSEELYNLKGDPSCFENEVLNAEYQGQLDYFRKSLPQRNRYWAVGNKRPSSPLLLNQMQDETRAFDFSKKEAIQYCLEKTRDTLKRMEGEPSTPVSIEEREKLWKTKPVQDWAWTHGFWPGILWYATLLSEDPYIQEQALYYTDCMQQVLQGELKSHDIGFIFNSSALLGYEATADTRFKEMAVSAADELIKLFDPEVDTLLSWPAKVRNGEYAPHNTIIDSLLNTELLFKVAKLTGNDKYRDVARRHVETVLRTHVRDDGSTYHLVVYDDQTGEVLRKTTHQGYAAGSTWARGQAWGIYGFSMAYRETRDPRFLDAAARLTEVFLERLPSDKVPFWDFDDPSIPNAPKDSSSAAIVASALIEMAGFFDDIEQQKFYIRSAKILLNSLSQVPYRSFSENSAFLDLSTGNKRRNREVEVPIVYADYYYLEALYRLTKSESHYE